MTLSSRRFSLGTRIEAAVFLATGAVLTLLRLHAVGVPLEYDECNYLYVGQRLAQGARLYLDLYDHHPPGLFVPFYGLALLAGGAVWAARAMGMALAWTAHTLLFALCRKTFTRSGGTFTVLALHALVSADPASQGDGVQRELLLAPLLLGTIFCQLRAMRAESGSRSGSPTLMWMAGLLAGLCTLVQTQTLVFLLFCAAGWFFTRVASGSRRPGVLRETVGIYALPVVALWAAVMAYFTLAGRGPEFLDAVVLSAGKRAATGWPGQGILDGYSHAKGCAGTWPIWLIGLVAAVGWGWRERSRRLVLFWTAGCLILIVLKARPWQHYYYFGLFPLLWWTGWAVDRVSQAGGESAPKQPMITPGRLAAIGLATGVILLTAGLQWVHYLSKSPEQITRARHGKAMLLGPRLGRVLADATRPEDFVFIYGRETHVYYYSGRRSSSRFLFALDEIPPDTPADDPYAKILLNELEANPPRVVVLREQPFEALHQWLMERYWRVATLKSYPGMVVLGRRDDMPEPVNWQVE